MKGQVSILYTIITIAIAFLLASGTFMFFRSFKTNSFETIGNAGLDSIAQTVEGGFLELHELRNATSAEIKLQVPQRIGEQRYYIAGVGEEIELRTVGDPSLVKDMQLKFWPDLRVDGTVDSAKGSISLVLLNSTHVLLR